MLKQDSRSQAETPSRSNPFKVNSRDAEKYGGKPAPLPSKCEFCESELYHDGLLDFRNQNEVMLWFIEPERCICDKSQKYWAKKEAEAETERIAEEQRKRDAKMQMRMNKLFRDSGIRGRFRNRTFEKFEVTPENRKAFNAAKRYADTFYDMMPKKDERGNITPPAIERNGLFMVGSYGTGKTHLATAIANQLISTGTPVIAMTMIDLLARIKQSYDSTDNASETDIMKVYEDIPLLIIEDIGSEQSTEWGLTKIYAIINARYEAYMPTIVTTNYLPDDLISRMTPGGKGGDGRNAEKTLDRLKEMCISVEMFWESWRSK